jgi:MtN3 and saliva related transmembrane protein
MAPPMQATELIGYAAATLTTVSFVPQVWKTFQSRDVAGISLGMYTLFTTGVAAWLVYGLLTRAWPLVAANGVTLALACAVLAMKLRFAARAEPPASGGSR